MPCFRCAETHRPPGTKSHSSPGAPTPSGWRPEAPSLDESPGRPLAFRPTSSREPPLLPWLRHQRRSFQPAFTRTWCALGPSPAGYSPGKPGPQEAHRLLQSKTVREHTSERPTLRHSRRGMPTAGRRTPLVKRGAHRAITGQGPTPCGRAFGPHRGDRSPRWIYPNLIDPDTPCREPVSRTEWIFRARRPCGNLGSFERTRLARHA